MELRYLSESFFTKYSNCPELMQKGKRPYVILLIQTEAMRFAVPFRSSMNKAKKYCYVTNKKKNSGLDFEKSVPIVSDDWLKDGDYPTINEYEFNYIKFDEAKIKYQFTVFLKAFRKYIEKRKANPKIPENKDFQFCTLKYFLKELGL